MQHVQVLDSRAEPRVVWLYMNRKTYTVTHVTVGVFIGEAALTMIQNVDYEVPYLRKQMAKCSQQMADSERRHAEYVRSAAACAANYKKVSSAACPSAPCP